MLPEGFLSPVTPRPWTPVPCCITAFAVIRLLRPYIVGTDMLSKFHTVTLSPVVLIWVLTSWILSLLMRGLVRPLPLRTIDYSYPIMKDKVVVVTGANSGIGKKTALGYAKLGATVVMAVRSKSRGEAAVRDIEEELIMASANAPLSHGVEETKDERKEEVIATTTATTPGRVGAVGRVVTMELDLMDLEHVKSFAQEFQSRFDRLDVLVCNAGVGLASGLTKQGHEIRMGVNYLAHFLLTQLLRDLMERTSDRPRVVLLTSSLHQFGQPDLTEDAFTPYTSTIKDHYCDSKLAIVLSAGQFNRREGNRIQELFERASEPTETCTTTSTTSSTSTTDASCPSPPNRVVAVSVNPGAVNTEVWRFLPNVIRTYIMDPVMAAFFLTADEGAVPTIAAGIEPTESLLKSVEVHGPELYMTTYWTPMGLIYPFDCIGVYVGWDVIRPRLPPNATHVGDKLWEMSMDLIRPFLTQPTEHHHNHHVQ